MQIEPPSRQAIDQRKANVKTGLILASVALVFFVGFVIKMFLIGK
jgi:hypothetical protein